MGYAAQVRRRFPRTVAGAIVVDLDALAAAVCTSVDEFPLSTGVLGCTVFEHGAAYTAIREGLRQDQPARYRFTLAHEVSEVLLRTYLQGVASPSRHERLCDAFAAELLLPHAVVQESLAVLREAGAPQTRGTLGELAQRLARTYDVSLAAARIAVADCNTFGDGSKL
jgi:AcrR family transcriptional regulator